MAVDDLIRATDWEPRLATQNELGRHLARVIGGREAAVFDRGEFRRWDADAPGWVLVPREEIDRAAAAYEGLTYCAPAGKPRTVYMSASKARGIVRQAEVELARPGFFSESVCGAAFKNIFCRVEGREVVHEPHRKGHRVYAEHVRCYELISCDEVKEQQGGMAYVQFVRELWAGCPDLIERHLFFLEYLGAAMLRRTWKFKDNPLLVGPKDTGKSVLLSVVRSVFPPGATTCVSLQAMGERFGLHPLVRGAVNVVTELPAARVSATEKAKAVLVGDEVQVEQKYRDPFPCSFTQGHVFAANELPEVEDSALRERLALLSCMNVVLEEEQDRELPERLAEERALIASLAIHVATQGVIARGRFVRPPSSETQESEWTTTSDTVAAWASATVGPGRDDEFARTSSLYSAYSAWCAGSGLKPVPVVVFGRRMQRNGFVPKNRGKRGFLVRFLTEAEREAAMRWKSP